MPALSTYILRRTLLLALVAIAMVAALFPLLSFQADKSQDSTVPGVSSLPAVVKGEQASSIQAPAQLAVEGRVIDSRTGSAVSGASVQLAGGATATTDGDGHFAFSASEIP